MSGTIDDPDTSTEAAASGSADAPGQPQFYRTPEPLTPERHGSLGLVQDAGFGFAATANSVMLTVPEFPQAARTYPIVFAGADTPQPVAVLGARPGENVFVKDGRWAPNLYVPAYVRRYPFAFQEQGERLHLCIDTSAEAVSAEADRKFFENGEPSGITRKALEFCRVFQTQHTLTRTLSEMLRDHALLQPRQAELTLPDGSKHLVRDFLAVDEKKLEALSDEAYLSFRKLNLLPFIYFHIMSMGNFRELGLRAG